MPAVSNSKLFAMVPPWPLRMTAAAKNHKHRIDLDLNSQNIGFVRFEFFSMKINHSCCFYDLNCTVSRDFEVSGGHQHRADGLQPF